MPKPLLILVYLSLVLVVASPELLSIQNAIPSRRHAEQPSSSARDSATFVPQVNRNEKRSDLYPNDADLVGSTVTANVYAGKKVRQNVGALMDEDEDATIIRLVSREFDPVTNKPYSWTRRFSTPSDVVAFSGRSFNDLLVVLDVGAELVVERWLVPDQPCGWRINSPTSPPGVPVVTPRWTREVVGSSWLPPAQRTPITEPERRTHLNRLSQGVQGVDEFRCLCIDPDGRSYFVVYRDRIEQYALAARDPHPTWILLASATGRDFARISRADFMDTSLYGRVLYLQGESPPRQNFVLIDTTNDGSIDLWTDAAVFTPSQSNPYLNDRVRQF